MQSDDLPVGGGQGSKMFESEQPPASSSAPVEDGPLENRLKSKNFATRAGALEELKGMIDKNDSNILKEYQYQYKVLLADSNPGALEKALLLFQSVVKVGDKHTVSEIQKDCLGVIIEKSIQHMKPTIKQKALEAVLLMMEGSGDFEGLVDPMLAQIKHKNIKVVLGAIFAVTNLLREFGPTKINIKDYLKSIEPYISHSNPGVRGEAINFYKEVSLWLGIDAIRPFIEKLKKQIVEDIEKHASDNSEKPKPKRYTREEAEKKKAEALNDAIEAAQEVEEKFDAFDLSEPQDVLPQFNDEWADNTMGLKKWQEKKEAMEAFIEKTNIPKIKNSPHQHLIPFLKKMMVDSNFNVSLAGIKSVGVLCKGLREGFQQGMIQLIGTLLLKFKEKRQMFIDEINNSLESALFCIKLQEIVEEIKPVYNEKSPNVKINVCLFMDKFVKQTNIDDLVDVGPELVKVFLAGANDMNGDVRDAALTTIGVIQGRFKVSGQEASHTKCQDIYSALNPQKSGKIDESAAKIEISKFDKSAKAAAAAAKKAAAAAKKAAAAAKKAPPKKAPPKAAPKDDDMMIDTGSMQGGAAPSDVIMADDELSTDFAPPKKPVKKGPPKRFQKGKDEEEKKESAPPPTSSSSRPAASAASKGPPKELKITEEDIGPVIGKEQATEMAQGLLPQEALANLEEAKWQQKVEGYQGIKAWFEDNKDSTSERQVEAIFKFISVKMKDWKESNVNIVKECIGTITAFSNLHNIVSKKAGSIVCGFLTEKLGDIKFKQLSQDALVSISELTTPTFVIKQMLKVAATAKAPNILKETSNTITFMIDEFSITVAGGMPLKEIIDYSKIAAAHTNPQVRTASMEMLRKLYTYVGEPLRSFLNDIKESTLKLIEDEFNKTTPLPKDQMNPKRELRVQIEAPAAAGGKGKKGGAAAANPLAALDDALPRVEIGKQISSKILKDMTDSQWKIRKEAGDKIEEVLAGANMRIQPTGLNDLVAGLKQRLTDSNKAVLKHYILLVGKIAQALGPSCKNFSKSLLKPMLLNITDKQELVRRDVKDSMNKWLEASGPEIILNQVGGIIQEPNPEGRTEMLKWVVEHKDGLPDCDKESLVSPLISCLQDKSPQIRNQTESIIIEVCKLIGINSFYNALSDLKPAIKQTIKGILDKIKPQLGGGSELASSINSAPAKEEKKTKPEEKKKAFQKKDDKVHSSAPNVHSEEQKKPAGTSTFKKAAPKTNQTTKDVAAAADEESFIRQVGNQKQRRQQDAKVEWSCDKLREDHVEKMKDNLRLFVGDHLEKQLFSTDFKHNVAMCNKFIAAAKAETDQFVLIQDIVMKWTSLITFNNSNTQCIKAVLDLYTVILDVALEIGGPGSIDPHDAHIMVSVLCEKTGINNKPIKEGAKNLILKVEEVWATKPLFSKVIHHLSLKNTKAIAECLEIISKLIAQNEMANLPEKEIKAIAKCVESTDKDMRGNAVAALCELYKLMGQPLWKKMGNLSQKSSDIVEQRFKSVKPPSEKTTTPNKTSGLSAPSKNSLQKSIPRPGTAKLQPPNNQSMSALKRGSMMATVQGAQSLISDVVNKVSNDVEEVKQARPQTAVPRPPVAAQKDNFMEEPEDIAPQERQEDSQGQEQSLLQDTISFDHPLMSDSLNIDDNMNIDEEEDKEPDSKLDQNIKVLKFGNLSKRVDALVQINEMFIGGQDSDELVRDKSNVLIEALTFVTNDIFDKPLEEIPIRFSKYFLTVVYKLCSHKLLLQSISTDRLFGFAEQILLRLLTEGLDQLGESGEGDNMIKNLNTTMLRLLEFCKPTAVFVVLIRLLKKYRSYSKLPKLPGLIIKCLLKVIRVSIPFFIEAQILDSIIDQLVVGEILLEIHEYLVQYPTSSTRQGQQEDMGSRIVKTIINELIKLKKADIWNDYKVIQEHPEPDSSISKQVSFNNHARWINIILKSLGQYSDNLSQTMGPTMSPSKSEVQFSRDPHREAMLDIFDEIKKNGNFENGIAILYKYLEQNPDAKIENYLKITSTSFQNTVKNALQALKSKNNKENSTIQQKLAYSNTTSNLRMTEPQNSAGAPQNSNQRISEYQQKLASLKSKFNGASSIRAPEKRGLGEQGGNNKGPDNLNSSYNQMSQLSQKWQDINKNSLRSSNEPKNNLSNTIGSSGQPSGLGSRLQAPSSIPKSGGYGQNSELRQKLNEMKKKLNDMNKN